MPLLTRWMQQDGEGPLLRLCQFIEEEAPSLLRRKNKGPDTGLQDWLSAPALKEHLTEAFFRHADTHHATTLSRALQVLEQSG